MRHFLRAILFGCVAAAVPSQVLAAPLTVVNVGAPAVNCVFNTACKVTVNDSVGNFTPPGDTAGGRLQSRTYPGVAPAPAAGKLAYVYRVDLTSVHGILSITCVSAISFTFGPITKEPYTPGALKDMFVVTSGGLGSVGVASATQVGSTVRVTFGAGGVCPGQTSYFFGLASATTVPVASTATLVYSPSGTGTTAIRVP